MSYDRNPKYSIRINERRSKIEMIELYSDLSKAYETGQQELIHLINGKYEFKNILANLYLSFEASAWYSYLTKHDLNAAKQYFYNCGLVDIEDVKSGNDIFGYKRNSPLNVAFSDCNELIDSFVNVEYVIRSGPQKGKTNKQLSQLGFDHIYIDTIIKAMAKDIDGLGSNLEIMERVFLKLKKHEALKSDYEYFKGVLNRDKDKIIEVINIMSTKEHKKRNKEPFYMKNIISQPGVGYAKIAWINGIEIEFDNVLIPNELLPVKPLNRYDNMLKRYKGGIDNEN